MSSHEYYVDPFGLPGDGSAAAGDAFAMELVDDCVSHFPPREPEQPSNASLYPDGEAVTKAYREQTAFTGGRFEDSDNLLWQDTQAQPIFDPSHGGDSSNLQTGLGPAVRSIGHPADSQFQHESSSSRPQHPAGLDVHPAPSNENEKSHQNDIRSSRPEEAGSGLIQKALPYSVSDSGPTANVASYYGPLGINNPEAASQQHTTDSSFVRPWKENGNLLGLGPGNIRASEGSVSEAPHSLTNVTAESDSFWASDGASFVSQNPGYPYKGGNLEPGTPATPQTGRYLHPSSSSASYRDAPRGSHSSGNRKRRASSLSAGNVSRQVSRGGLPAAFRRANSQRSSQEHSQGDNDFGERPWACPLAQKCGNSSHRCYGWTFADVSRVKQHLNRDHASEITEDQFKKISVRMPTKDVESWKKIFRILFPESEQLPSPFFNAQFDVQHRISPESLRDHLLSRVENLDHMSSEQKEGFRRFIAETSHTFLHQARHDSRHDPKEPSAYYGLGSGPQQQGNLGNIQHPSQSFGQRTEAYPSVLPDEVARGGPLRGVGDGNVMLSGQDEQQLPFGHTTGFNTETPTVPANSIDLQSISVFTNTAGD
ncbi:hypothetical protein VFPPC_03935 [Pochonia chlamydosporia 170]|uniref:Uncharacterized protein n=1 Tax=Pochonia chlamydosporia 170 TaxID=1380566 RepID=A0A179F2S6_METCM|nr:hypothetical protein VFPPC_03935 [Pochonia chlamydosporia 170]OAQ59728.1 hypothetical protein VFPPC_03935 [Pochonia chlamydosporia 170]